ncbi:MAG: hypothetical protein M3R00_09940, partial [Pseudomonadota bacterium]|nr:hypothetical protein [Pseudomonadota bacterium]
STLAAYKDFVELFHLQDANANQNVFKSIRENKPINPVGANQAKQNREQYTKALKEFVENHSDYLEQRGGLKPLIEMREQRMHQGNSIPQKSKDSEKQAMKGIEEDYKRLVSDERPGLRKN